MEDEQFRQLLNVLLLDVQAGNWRALTAALLVVVVAVVRAIAPKLDGRLGLFVKSDRGGALLAILGGIAGALTTALLARQTINVSLLISGVITGVLAAGGFNVVKKLFAPSDAKLTNAEVKSIDHEPLKPTNPVLPVLPEGTVTEVKTETTPVTVDPTPAVEEKKE